MKGVNEENERKREGQGTTKERIDLFKENPIFTTKIELKIGFLCSARIISASRGFIISSSISYPR